MLRSIELHGASTPIHFYCSSGGNAGLACAYAAVALKRRATIVVPLITSQLMVGKLRTLGVEVHQVGKTWFDADSWMRGELMGQSGGDVEVVVEVYVSPFDHEWVWEGASGLMSEVVEDVGEVDAIVCSVGGGGLFNGIMEGISKIEGLRKPVVLAMETIGAESLHRSLVEGEHIRLDSIDSIATSLGASKVSEQTYKLAQDKRAVVSRVVPDKDAVMACIRFANEERLLVEPACGVTMTLAYQGQLKEALESAEGSAKFTDEEWKRKKVVLVVCGGSNITLDMLEDYRKRFA